MGNRITIVGAGLCGSLLALAMGRRGYNVELYEKRSDMRKASLESGRSINLALSSRGLQALKMVGMQDKILDSCIPMKGRMLHLEDGTNKLSPYSGRSEDYINSISRSDLNIALLNEIESLDNVSVHFDIACESVNMDDASCVFLNNLTDEKIKVEGDVVIGTDGAGSVIRRSMISLYPSLFDCSQDFLDYGYKELSIAPKEDGGFRIDNNALHIWPRNEYMTIALPNLDGSFTVTMFHPHDAGEWSFERLNDPEIRKSFFEEYYKELVALMPDFVEQYDQNPVGRLGTIKCDPWQLNGKILIMGDAAHAIVPFYGQGMNASFEDVYVFDKVLEKVGGNWENVFVEFQKQRTQNANAIADLALDNFHEMRDGVINPNFIKKRQWEMKLEEIVPNYYSKYSMVTFRPDLSYSDAMELGREQDRRLLKLIDEGTIDSMSLKEIAKAVQPS